MASRFTGGRVGGNGIVINGTGDFVVQRTGTGHYNVIFDPDFSVLAAFVVTQVPGFDGNTRDNATVISAEEHECRVKTGNQDGDASDRGFSFIAIGD